MLAKFFQISADEAMNVRPSWEIANLLERHARDEGLEG